MDNFQYKARDKSGKLINGFLEGDDEKEVVHKITERGYTPISVKLAAKEKSKDHLSFLKSIRPLEINIFTRQFSAMQKAGIPILLSLETLREQTINPKLRSVIEQVTRNVETGMSLSSALEKHPDVFKPLYISMIKTGEASGTMSKILDRLALLGEYDEKVRRGVKAAIRYPVMVVVAIVVAFVVLITFVIPKFLKLFNQFTVQLPLPTRILIWLNYVCQHYWWVILIVVAVLILSARKFISTKYGRWLWDGFCLNVPVFGQLFLKMIMSRFTRITGILMKHGVPLFDILALSSEGVGNVIVAKAIGDIKTSISAGRGISEPMKESKLFPPIVIQMVSIGEQTGKLDDLLLFVSDYYDDQIEYTVANLTSLIEPILIFSLGFFVLFMALGIFLPMWDIMNIFQT